MLKYNYLRTAIAKCEVKIGDIEFNVSEMKKIIQVANENNVDMIVFPKLSVTSLSLGHLFLNDNILNRAISGIKTLKEISHNTKNMIITASAPLKIMGVIYICNVVFYNGKIIGICPENDFEEQFSPYFSKYTQEPMTIKFLEEDVLFGNLTFSLGEKTFRFLNCMDPFHINNISDVDIIISPKAELANYNSVSDYAGSLITLSRKFHKAYIIASASSAESSTLGAYSGILGAFVNGEITNMDMDVKKESAIIVSDIDLDRITKNKIPHNSIGIECVIKDVKDFHRQINTSPFKLTELAYDHIFDIMVAALRKRLTHVGTTKTLIGISGGLDSTMALLTLKETYDFMKLDSKDIIAISMPAFGTSDRTFKNAKALAKELGVTYKEINIKNTLISHFNDIGADINNYNLTFENAQARERTQILFDLANEYGGIVIGTGDMSEIALGFSTYGGDQLSNYNVNSGLPKTLIRYLITYKAENYGNDKVKKLLLDVVNTPVSPELLPAKGDEISQKTEDIVGPYELIDFFMYNVVTYGYSHEKMLFLANKGFGNLYSEDEIKAYYTGFTKRFVKNQFKRNCAVDGIRVLNFDISPSNVVIPSDVNFI